LVQRYLTKPVPLERLQDMVHELLLEPEFDIPDSN
jgi:hypothetical protein